MKIDFSKDNGLVPAIIQDAYTKEVLMLGYMNEEAYNKTVEIEKVTFFSRSKQRLWTKGEESGNFLILKDIKVDCDNDTLLIKAVPQGPTCHKGTDTCWGGTNDDKLQFLNYLKGVIQDRYDNPDAKSYTNSLFKDGINRIAQKVGEEAVETVIEAKDDNDDLFKGEVADLIFHTLVLLRAKNVDLNEVIEVLQGRHK